MSTVIEKYFNLKINKKEKTYCENMKRQVTNSEKAFAKHISDKGFVSRKLNNKTDYSIFKRFEQVFHQRSYMGGK